MLLNTGCHSFLVGTNFCYSHLSSSDNTHSSMYCIYCTPINIFSLQGTTEEFVESYLTHEPSQPLKFYLLHSTNGPFEHIHRIAITLKPLGGVYVVEDRHQHVIAYTKPHRSTLVDPCPPQHHHQGLLML